MLREDLKIFKPERLGSAPNAGGYRTNSAIQSGKLNDVFSAISEVEHASSAFEIVKLYPAVATGDASSLNRAHVFISDQPDDKLVSTLIAESSSLTDASLFVDMSQMLRTAKYHGTTTTTSEASGNTLSLRDVSRTVAPMTIKRIAHVGVQIGEGSQYRTTTIESFGTMTQVNLDVPDLLIENPDYYGTYSYWASGWQRWALERVLSNTISRTGTALKIDLPVGKPLAKGKIFTLHYRSNLDFRWHQFPASLTLGAGESIAKGQNRVKRASSGDVLVDDGEGNFVDQGYVIATIDYVTGVITENEPLSYNGSISENLGLMIVRGEQVKKLVQFNLNLPLFDLGSFYIKCKTAAGSDISAACDSAGNITGSSVSTGSISATGDVSIEFSVDILPSTIRYDVDELEEITVPSPPNGIDYNLLPTGSVPIIHEEHLICIQHRDRNSHSSLTNGQTVNAISGANWLDIVDSEGKSLYSLTDDNYSYDRTLGTVTIKAGVSAFTAPFIITAIQSELVQVDSINGQDIQLLTSLSKSYPAGSTVSSVQRLGNFQARSSDERTVSAWQNNFGDTGASASNTVNTIQYPIQMINSGAINQRWAVVFTSNTEFTVYGETLGAVLNGSISSDCKPINPFVNSPYFTILSAAFGSGLNIGEAFLFTTYASSKPTMLIRSISPGHTNIEHDSSTISFRGFY